MGRTCSVVEKEGCDSVTLWMVYFNVLCIHQTLSPRQGLYNLLGGYSSGGYEICELPVCKWISNCCKYSFRRKLLSTREENFFFKKQRQYTVHLNVFLVIITFCRLKKIQIE